MQGIVLLDIINSGKIDNESLCFIGYSDEDSPEYAYILEQHSKLTQEQQDRLEEIMTKAQE